MPDREESRNTFTAIVARWERLLAGAEANKDDMPALEKWRARLEAAVGDTKVAHERRVSREAEAHQATQELYAMLRLGRDLAAQFESGVRLLYGRRSPKLAEFGIKPLLPRVKKKQAPSG